MAPGKLISDLPLRVVIATVRLLSFPLRRGEGAEGRLNFCLS